MSIKYSLAVLALAVACFATSPAQAALTSAERKATQKFLEKFVGEYKGQLKHLWTGSDYCDWDGVTCDASGDVHIDLSGRGLDGDLPEPKKKEGSLIRVVSIDLSNNPKVGGDFEDDWRCLTNLKSIDLSYTSLKGYVPDKWREMSALEELRIHHTAACRNLPDWSAATMPNLRVVDLSYNNFHGSIRGDWASFSKLEQFDISGNSLCGCTPASWQGVHVLAAAAAQTALAPGTCAYNNCASYKTCPKTPNTGGPASASTSAAPTTAPSTTTTTAPAYDRHTYNVLVTIAQSFPNQLSGWTGTDFCAWSGVDCNADGSEVSVVLGGVGLAGTLLDRVAEVDGENARIVSIDLSGNSGVAGRFPNSYASLKRLRSIDLSSTSLSSAIPSSWNGMISVEEIKISNTKACTGLPNWAMPSLKRVDLSNNNLKGALASSWTKLVNLQSADLSGNSFCSCVPASWAGRPALQAAVDTADNAAALRATTCWLTNMCSYPSYRCY